MTTKIAKLTLLVIALLTGLFLYQTTKIEFEYEMEKFFPQDDENTAFYNKYRKEFSSDNDFLLIGIEAQKTIYSQDFLNKTHAFYSDLLSVGNVENVVSIFNLPGGFYTDNILDSVRVKDMPLLTSSFVGENSKRMMMLLLHQPYLSKKGCDNLVKEVDGLVKKHQLDDVHFAGRSVAQKYFIETSQQEMALFISIALTLLIVVLYFTFRTFWGVAVPLLVVLLATIWTVGVMTLLGEPFNLLLTILPTIIFVVGISDVIHIVSRFLDLLREKVSKLEAIKTAFKEVGSATLFTSITTAVGFLTLLISDIKPIQSFGLYTAIGVVIAYVLAFSFLPSILILTQTPKNQSFDFGSRFWRKRLNQLFRFILLKRKSITILFLIITLASGFGVYQLKIENLMLDDLKESTPLKQDFNFFDDNFSGVRPFEMQVSVVDSTKDVFSKDVLLEVQKLQTYLENQYGVNSIVSPVTTVKVANHFSSFSSNSDFIIPKSKRKLRQLEKQIKSNTQEGLFSKNYKKARLSGRVKDEGSTYYLDKNAALHQFIKDSISIQLIDVKLTGSAELIDQNNRTISISLLQGLVLAFLVVVAIVGFIFKSYKMVLIALIPNILPLLMIGGIMGFFGIEIKVSTSIIFTIAFGIAVDDTLHFLNKLKRELTKGKSLSLAVRSTFISSGKAIIITSIILFSAFMTLIASSFLGNVYVGLLVSLTLLFAVIIDLFLLPLLILRFYKNH